jgi:uncharacterized protein (UPF0276 family)
MTIDEDFARRVRRIDPHSLGLSVDLYSPDLFDLSLALQAEGLIPGYLEIFKGSMSALSEASRRLRPLPLEYHAEGLWLSQPDMADSDAFDTEMETAAQQVRTLGSQWLNHECASKQIAGYSFGTYLPPLFTNASADVTAENIALVQARLDRADAVSAPPGALVLVEVPPLTYFGFGDLDVAMYFRRVAERVACGLVLDIGHLWTVYRYGDAWRRSSPLGFMQEFLEVFPLERVVQIHVAGLALHALSPSRTTPPLWIDAHEARIPDVLFEMLAALLQAPGLVNLKGIALEVDQKPIPDIIEEFRQFRQRFGWWTGRTTRESLADSSQGQRFHVLAGSDTRLTAERETLHVAYRNYARAVTTAQVPTGKEFSGAEFCDQAMVDLYASRYLPHEILQWGGDLRQMFPSTCGRLEESGIGLDTFVAFWFREPRPAKEPYDFFLLKIERFVSFVEETLPVAVEIAAQEAADLRVGYHIACEEVSQSGGGIRHSS